MSNFFLFSGTSNLPLAEKLAKKLTIKLGKIEIFRFPDGECRVRIEEDVKGKTVYLLQSLSKSVDEHLFELCLMVDSAKRLGAREIIGIIPWLGYSKQDKEFRVGEAVSVEMIAKILSLIGLSKVIVFDLHSEIIKRYFKIPVTELSAKEMLYRALLSNLSNLSNVVVVSPDKGGKGRAERFAKDYKLPIVYLEKRRNLNTGKITYEKQKNGLEGKIAVIFDDIVNRGGTVIKAAELLKEMGAKKVIVLATHGVLGGEAPKSLQNSKVDKIYLTDTIEIPKEKQFPKLKIVSVVETILKSLK